MKKVLYLEVSNLIVHGGEIHHQYMECQVVHGQHDEGLEDARDPGERSVTERI